jgi:hypothetical protein
MPAKDAAAYMRAYRAKHKDAESSFEDMARSELLGVKYDYAKRILDLEDEVKHLKAELTDRPVFHPNVVRNHAARAEPGFNSRPFTPVPRGGKGK